jgi:hypothetical protein
MKRWWVIAAAGALMWTAGVALSVLQPELVVVASMINFVGGCMLGCGVVLSLINWLDR